MHPIAQSMHFYWLHCYCMHVRYVPRAIMSSIIPSFTWASLLHTTHRVHITHMYYYFRCYFIYFWWCAHVYIYSRYYVYACAHVRYVYTCTHYMHAMNCTYAHIYITRMHVYVRSIHAARCRSSSCDAQYVRTSYGMYIASSIGAWWYDAWAAWWWWLMLWHDRCIRTYKYMHVYSMQPREIVRTIRLVSSFWHHRMHACYMSFRQS